MLGLYSANVSENERARIAALNIASIAELKAVSVSGLPDKLQALVGGYYSHGDSGGGVFYYDAGSSATDNGGTIIAPTAGAGRWKRVYSGAVNVSWFGAQRNGPDCTAAYQAAHDASNVAGAKVKVGPFSSISDYHRINSTVTCRAPMVGVGNSRVNQPVIRTYITNGTPTFKWSASDGNNSVGGLLWSDIVVKCESSAITTVFSCGTSSEDVNSRWSLRNVRVSGAVGCTAISFYGWVICLYDFSATGCGVGVNVKGGNTVEIINACIEANTIGLKLEAVDNLYCSGTIEGNTSLGIELAGACKNLHFSNVWMEKNGGASQPWYGMVNTGGQECSRILFDNCTIDSFVLSKVSNVHVTKHNKLAGEIDIDYTTCSDIRIDVDRWANANAFYAFQQSNSYSARATEYPLNFFPNPYFDGGLRGLTGAITLTNVTVSEESLSTTIRHARPTALKITTIADGTAKIDVAINNLEGLTHWLGKKVFTCGWVYQETNTGSSPVTVTANITVDGTTYWTKSASVTYKYDKWFFWATWIDLVEVKSGVITASKITLTAPTKAGAISRITGVFIGTGFDYGRVSRGEWSMESSGGIWIGTQIWVPGSSAPTNASSAWKVGDRIFLKAPSAGGAEGYICTTAGSPGTWKTFGSISE